jgi:ubiquinone/menaquinone biosynthesis C-methylase UbiE
MRTPEALPSAGVQDSYVIAGGRAGADRLKVLAEATWPASSEFLSSAGLERGMRCLDLGCGSGEISLRLLSHLGPTGQVVGCDRDELMVRLSQAAVQPGHNARFHVVDIEAEPLAPSQPFDLIYARFLLSHLRSPAQALDKMIASLRPGGILVVEDVDFDGHFSFPASPAFDRYVELYRAAALKRGADPGIGPRLPGLFEERGLRQVSFRVVQPAFREGPGKSLALLTMMNIKDAAVESGLITHEEAAALKEELRRFTDDPRSILSLPRIFQVAGVRAAPDA